MSFYVVIEFRGLSGTPQSPAEVFTDLAWAQVIRDDMQAEARNHGSDAEYEVYELIEVDP